MTRCLFTLWLCVALASCSRASIDLSDEYVKQQYVRLSIETEAARKSCDAAVDWIDRTDNLVTSRGSAYDLSDSPEYAAWLGLQVERCSKQRELFNAAWAWGMMCGPDCYENDWWRTVGLNSDPMQ